MIKKILTSCESEVYAESLKTSYKRLSHPSDLRFFCNLIGLSRAGNILNTSQSFLVTAFSEATHLTQFCVGFSKKRLQDMTNTAKRLQDMTNTIINSLYSQYQQLEAVSGANKREMLAVLDQLINTPTNTLEDRKIKFSVGCVYVELCNQLAAE